MKTKKLTLYKLAAYLLATMLALSIVPISAMAYAAEPYDDGYVQSDMEFVSGILPEEYELSYPVSIAPAGARVGIMAAYDPYYDPRDVSMTTSVKNQGPNGLCWAFSAYGAMESYMVNNGFGEQDLSELHMAYSTSTSNGNTAQGFSIRTKPTDGGNRLFAAAYLMRGTNLSGAVNEADDPYTLYENALVPARTLSITQSMPKSYRAENILFLGGEKASISKDAIKEAVRLYGAVGASM